MKRPIYLLDPISVHCVRTVENIYETQLGEWSRKVQFDWSLLIKFVIGANNSGLGRWHAYIICRHFLLEKLILLIKNYCKL